jgi:hypothetical protein
VFLSALVLLAGPRVARAQWLRVGAGGEAGVEARDDRYLNGDRSMASNTQFTQWLSIPLSGAVISSELLSYSLSIRPTWGKQSVAGLDGKFDRRAVGLGGTVNVLPSALVSLALNGDRISGASDGGPGTMTRNTSQSAGGSLRLRSMAFPIVAEWHRRQTMDSWRATADQAPILRDETLRTLRVSGQSSKLRVSVEQLRFEDRVGDLGFNSIGGFALHNLLWGKGSNMQTLLETLDRDGLQRQRRRALSERLLLQHTKALSTEYIADGRKNDAPEGASSEYTSSAGVRFRPREWITAGFRALTTSSAFSAGRLSRSTLTPELRLEARLPAGGHFSGSVVGGYERIVQRLPSDSWIQVIDEGYTLAESRVIVLTHDRADATSVRVFNPERTIAYIAGIDYRVSLLGAAVRLDVPLASRIAVGTTVAVSYRYQAQAEGRFDVRSVEATLSLAMGGFSLTPSASMRRGHVLPGADSGRSGKGLNPMGTGDDFVLAAGFHRLTTIGQIDIDVAKRAREYSQSDYTIQEARAGYQPRAFGPLRSSVSATVSRTTSPGQVVRAVASNAVLSWSFTDALQLTGSRESWRMTPSDNRLDATVIWNVELGYSSGLVEAELRYVMQRRLVVSVNDNQRRLFGRLVRRF